MVLSQYSDMFYMYILLIMFIPAIVLGLMEKNIKYYGTIASIFMIIVLLGYNTAQMKMFLMFFFGEVLVIKTYLYIRKKSDNKNYYFLFLFFSMLPLIITKLSVHTKFNYLGFLGLSYLNFKAIQMIIEIYDGGIKEVSFFNLSYFLTFFPTLSSGPVDRSKRFESDLNKTISRDEYINEYLYIGIKKIIWGMLYKFAIAYFINTHFLMKISQNINFINTIKYMYTYSLYLFFDFAGYSFFAIGTSYIFGIKTPENFNKPFISKDMKEFWTRWHISLSRWFGDYIYTRFVLNALRKKWFKNRKVASHVGQILTMLLMGIWHGVYWFYIIYGLYQGIVLVLTDIYQRKSKFHKKYKNNYLYKLASIFITFNIICFGLLLFSGYMYKG